MIKRTISDLVLGDLTFHGPGTYQIAILGTLDKVFWFDWLEQSTITTHATDRGTVTILTCQFRDQAALLGVLNALYDWHFLLVWVEYLANPAETDYRENK